MPKYRLPAQDLEHSVLAALWELGTASVRELHERVGVPAGYVYTTTAKIVDRLREKRLVTRRRQGQGFVYSPAVERNVVERARARNLLNRFLGRGPHAAAAALVEAADDIDPRLLEELERAIRNKRRSRNGT